MAADEELPETVSYCKCVECHGKMVLAYDEPSAAYFALCEVCKAFSPVDTNVKPVISRAQ